MTGPEPASVGIEVPASCANLGPGFDSLAAAVDLYLVAWTAPRGAERVSCEGEGAGELPTDGTNLVWKSFTAYCRRFGVEAPDVSVRACSDIPLERGLGSSAAAAVAGVALARAATGAGGGDGDLIDLVGEVEGHADNAAAAMLGGIVVCADGQARRLEPAPGLRPVVCVPTERQSTAAARAILPREVALRDAAAGAGRTALVLAGLTGACAFDPVHMVDVLHEPARLDAMPETGRLVRELRSAGIAACLSGAGPSVLAVVSDDGEDTVRRVRESAGAGWEVRPSRWDLAGAAVCPPVVGAQRTG